MRSIRYYRNSNQIERQEVEGRFRISRCIEIATEKSLVNLADSFQIFEGTTEENEQQVTDIYFIRGKAMKETTKKAIESYNLTITAMNSVIKTTNSIIDELGKGYTLKAAKSELNDFVADTANLPIGIKKDIKDADKAKTKALYIESLELVKGNMVKAIKVALDAVKDIEDGAKNDKPELDEKALETMANEIKTAIETATIHYMKAGQILSNALEMFKASGKPAKDWLEWANLACQVKKAQAYSLVKIYNDFGQVSEFKDCSMRVLNILVHCSKDIYSKIEEQAKALAKAGKLDTKAINKLIDAYKPVNANSTLPKTSPAKSDTSDKKVKDQTGDTIKASLESNDTGDNNGDNNGQDKVELGTSTDRADKASKVDEKDKLIAELREQNLQLLARIEELSNAVKSSKEDDNTKTVTYLPQFENSEPYLVLGISPVAGKDEINKHYRTMAVIFNAKTCPRGAKALKAAREAMLKTAKN